MSNIKCEMSNAYIDPWGNFCFHAYAQKVKCQMSNAQVDPWDMLNNFCVKSLWGRTGTGLKKITHR